MYVDIYVYYIQRDRERESYYLEDWFTMRSSWLHQILMITRRIAHAERPRSFDFRCPGYLQLRNSLMKWDEARVLYQRVASARYLLWLLLLVRLILQNLLDLHTGILDIIQVYFIIEPSPAIVCSTTIAAASTRR